MSAEAPPARGIQRPPVDRAFALTLVLTVLGAAVFMWLSLSRHAAFQSHAFDLGNVDQAVWNTLHGHVLRFTDMQAGHIVYTTRLAIHVEPLLLPIALLYLVHSGPETLLTLQAVVVAAGAVPTYLLARDVLGFRWLGIVFPLAYLFHPSLENLVLDDFHAVALSSCFLLWAALYGFRDRPLPFLAWGVLAASTKEDVGLVVAGLAIVFFAPRRRALFAVATSAAGLAWFLVCLLVIIPHNNPAGHSPYVLRYGYLGRGVQGIVTGAITHPDVVASTLLSVPRLFYLFTLLHPLGLLSLAGLPVLLAGFPAFVINALSADPTMYSGYYQYAAETVPVAVASAVFGIAVIGRGLTRVRARGAKFAMPALALFLFAATLLDTWEFGFTPVANGYIIPHASAHQRLEQRLLGGIPAHAPVAAADEMEPHLSDRFWTYLLPTTHPRNGPPADWLALDASIAGLPVTPRQLHMTAANALAHGYGVSHGVDGILILRRGARDKRIPQSFFKFLYDVPASLPGTSRQFGPLRLTGFVVHPRNGVLNRSRPAIGVDTYWRRTGVVGSDLHIFFALSRVYTGLHPAPDAATVSTDSPAWDWVRPASWPPARTVHAASLPLLPAAFPDGKVDVYVGVAKGVIRGAAVPAGSRLMRLDTIDATW